MAVMLTADTITDADIQALRNAIFGTELHPFTEDEHVALRWTAVALGVYGPTQRGSPRLGTAAPRSSMLVLCSHLTMTATSAIAATVVAIQRTVRRHA